MVSVGLTGHLTAKFALLFCAGALGAPAQTPTVSRPVLSPEQRADVYMARKMYREAIDVYSLAPAESAARWNKIGIAYHQLLDLPAAKRNYEHAVKLRPDYGEAINNLGTVYYAEKSYRRAIREYKKALRVMPDSASVYSNLGTAYFARQDFKHAGECYQKALTIDPDVFDHHNTFGVMLEEHTVAERAKFHYYLAKMYAKQNRPDRVLLYVRKALEEGFNEKKRFLVEPEFASMRDNVEFQELLNSRPRVL